MGAYQKRVASAAVIDAAYRLVGQQGRWATVTAPASADHVTVPVE